jgi:arylsulfatase A-like enzyme/4-amino-4-deoxy-L-arabinose transferase-like glycosyltransferase
VLAVVLVALLVRAVALVAAAGLQPLLDEQLYAQRAAALLDGRGFLGSYQSWVLHDDGLIPPADLPQYPGAWQPPGQSLFMAGVMALTGRSLFAVKAAQVLLGAVSVWLVYLLGRAWQGEREGLAAAWLVALYPNLIAFTHYLWSETLFTFLLLLGLWWLTRRPGLPGTGSTAAAGAVFGLAALTRSSIFYFLPLLAAWLVWSRPPHGRAALARGALLLALAALVVAPWSVRNTRLHGGFVLLDTNGPYNLWRGNGPDSFDDRDDPAQPRYAWPLDGFLLAPVMNRPARRLVEEAKQALRSATPSDLQVIAHARRAAWREIRAHPLVFLERIRYRLADMWNPTSFLIRHLQVGAYGKLPPGLATLLALLAAGTYLGLVALAAAGFWLSRRRPETWLVALLVAFTSAITAVSFGLTRFRLPLEPLLAIVAAPALLALWRRRPRAASAGAALALAPLWLGGCTEPAPPPRGGPNILFVVWDTVRADHLGLHGHARPTTPRLEAWAAGARVFEDTTSPAGYTIPSHASLFTGLLPSEHCVHNGNQRLDDGYVTLAELLRDGGYRTFLYSENPNVSADPGRNFAQGFETAVHPWSPGYLDEALRIAESKLPEEERTSELRERIAAARRGQGPLTPWNVKAAGAIGERALLAWLAQSDAQRPWFAFFNYMEAHRPYIPPREYREALMSEAEVAASYRVDRSWRPLWEYTFGLREYTQEELELTRKTYDAAILELDALFASLLDALARAGQLDDTAVVLTSDHGEHLGEQHMLDHQYSVYEAVLRVPLVIHYPARFAPGRSDAPVMSFDLFPTLLALAGVAAPADLDSAAVSLLAPASARGRLAEEPAASDIGIAEVKRLHPEFDPAPFRQRLRAWTEGAWKYLWRSGGSHSLYHLEDDPFETRDRIDAEPERARRLAAALESFRAPRARCRIAPAAAPVELSPEERERLRVLGYAEEEEAAP